MPATQGQSQLKPQLAGLDFHSWEFPLRAKPFFERRNIASGDVTRTARQEIEKHRSNGAFREPFNLAKTIRRSGLWLAADACKTSIAFLGRYAHAIHRIGLSEFACQRETNRLFPSHEEREIAQDYFAPTHTSGGNVTASQ